MITVPAQSFCEPRAAFTAAARSMPGVCGVLPSSRSLLMTLTPSVRQSRIDFIASPPAGAPVSTRQRLDQHVPVGQPVIELLDADPLVQTVRKLFAVHDEHRAHAVGRYPGVAVHRTV